LKADKSLVTEADLAADRLIATRIGQQYPRDILLSEELQTSAPSGVHDQAVWIVDPVDGTANFSLGLHFWGILITRLVSGWPDVAALYYPVVDELYTAQRGAGAYLNGSPIRVKMPDPQRPAAFFSCCSRTFRHYQISVPYKTRILGSASYSFCALARGIAVLSFEVSPKLWDIAGAWLLVEEAGGTIETYQGPAPFPLLPELDYAGQNFPTLAAATPELMAKARQWILPKLG
jgi:myo-inositol-1(or 4)-monophosphatase